MSVIPKSPVQASLKKRTGDTNAIFIHCADTPPSMDIGWRDINQWHVRDNGWSAGGYHVVIRRDGTIEAGRPLDAVGAHVASRNGDSVGVCLIGGLKGKRTDPIEKNFTKEQEESLKVVLKELSEKYPEAKVIGHHDVANKECPAFDVKAWWANH